MSDAPAPIEQEQAPAAPASPADYEALYRKEVADRINERNLHRPAQQLINGLDEGSRAAIMELADLARSGDTEAIIEWNLRTMQQVSGKDAAALIAERQAKEQQVGAKPTEAPADKPPTAAEIQAMVNAEFQRAQTARDNQAAVAAEMQKSGYRLDSAVGETIIRYAVSANASLGDAIAWFENDMATTAAERAKAAVAAAASIPGSTPNGVPVASTPDSPAKGESEADFRRRNILAKLTAGPTN